MLQRIQKRLKRASKRTQARYITAFHWNLNVYNANTQHPVNQNPKTQHTALCNIAQNYTQNVTPTVNVAGFTEVLVANNATPANVKKCLNEIGDGLNIPKVGGNRYTAVIRCGRSALNESSETVAILLDGNATNIQYNLDSFEIQGNQPSKWMNTPINCVGYDTMFVTSEYPSFWQADYRFPVSVSFTLNGQQYNIGFVHNRRPGEVHTGVLMDNLRKYMEGKTNIKAPPNLLGGDFNITPACNQANKCIYPPNGHHKFAYYSSGANTTPAHNYDYFISKEANAINQPIVTVTQTAPLANGGPNHITGSDHRGVGISF
eukprot:TRINITY_DN12249_c0_g1_i1.p1 TRINITY_DN12249_c0_g1~~TRINITY_DN12249_c0_g1_i1.p1  ORF type:complete len:318 (+),score=35.06 TRINITY_DN12249_c0_g1_i1:95-1048(+)